MNSILKIYLRSDISCLWNVKLEYTSALINKDKGVIRLTPVCEYYILDDYLYKKFRNHNVVSRILIKNLK